MLVVQVGVGDIGGTGRYRGCCGAGVHQKDGRCLEEGEEKKHLIRGLEGPGCAPFEKW